jgi:adenylyl-sulfate kinase
LRPVGESHAILIFLVFNNGLSMSHNVTWQQPAVDREQRWRALGQEGATIWLTGLPGAGKTTLAHALEARLVGGGRNAYCLDGDNLRHGVCGDLGFSHADREANVNRVGQIARLFADAGAVAVVALVSPYADGRERVRELHARDGLAFIEVYLNTPLRECERRDPKGLYVRARAGELDGLTGVDAPYQPPGAPDVEITPQMDIDAAVDAVLETLEHSLRQSALLRA